MIPFKDDADHTCFWYLADRGELADTREEGVVYTKSTHYRIHEVLQEIVFQLKDLYNDRITYEERQRLHDRWDSDWANDMISDWTIADSPGLEASNSEEEAAEDMEDDYLDDEFARGFYRVP